MMTLLSATVEHSKYLMCEIPEIMYTYRVFLKNCPLEFEKIIKVTMKTGLWEYSVLATSRYGRSRILRKD